MLAQKLAAGQRPADDSVHFTLNTSTPGRALPSIHSRKAPPAADT
jgi:hypothetical protein